MDLIIVDQNINYTKSLREFCLEFASFKNVIIYRNLEELLDAYLPKKGIILFESNKENLANLDKIKNISSNLTLVALSDSSNLEQESEMILKGASSIIAKAQRLESILQEIKMIVKGQRILPKSAFETLRISEKLKTNSIQTPIKSENTFSKFFKSIIKI